MNEILNFLPEILKEKIKQANVNAIEEIRIRAAKPVILKNNIEEMVLDYIITKEEMMEILQKICDNSLYSYQNQICDGFITIKGGHRIRNYRECSYKRWKSNKFKLY